MHERRAIREACKAQLVAAATVAGSRVYETRSTPFARVELPAIAIYTESEESEDKQSAPRELTRTLELKIEACVEALDNVDDSMDAIALQIETAMDSDWTLTGTVGDSVLTETTLEIAVLGTKPVGVVIMTYTVLYHTDMRIAAILPDFTTAVVNYDLANSQPDPRDQAQDELDNLDT